MPELPEVEVVRRGLEAHVVGRVIRSVQVLHPRAVRRHLAGPQDFVAAIRGLTVTGARRRGKYLWLPLAATASTPVTEPRPAGAPRPLLAGQVESPAGDALLAHLGMSGQMLLADPARPLSPHVRVRFEFADTGPDLRFTDQRTFGHVMLAPGGARMPAVIAHIAPDPMEADFDEAAVIANLLARRTGVKTALLDQSLISGIGNIYADEALWRAGIHWSAPAGSLRRAQASRLLAAVREVLGEALAAGGTSFDSLYVNVNGESGYFGRSLAVYGREGGACLRCGTPIRRDRFANRSAFSCPSCQKRPRARIVPGDLRRRST